MSVCNEIVFVNYKLDNVHGFIGLTALEDRIEYLPIFKRLQDISQLGLIKRIFPAALHNRYIHSLGVMHVIDQMAVHLKQFSPAERQLLRLAGMLHDLGHYPLSHDLEQVYMDINATPAAPLNVVAMFQEGLNSKIKKIIEEANKPINIKPKKQLLSSAHFHHESVTARVIRASTKIKQIIQDGVKIGSFDEEDNKWSDKSSSDQEDVTNGIIDNICALIQGNSDHKPEYFIEHFSAMLQMLHSELDADRIDYMLRDATFSGASYGSFDIGLLLRNLDMTKSKHGVWVIGVKAKGVGCADQFLINRYLAYTQVIHHKHTSIIANMLRVVTKWMIENCQGFNFYKGKEVDEIISSHEQNTKYYSFTDTYFFSRLNDIRKDDDGCPEDVYFFVKKLREYLSLDVMDENVFSGDAEQQKAHFENEDIYKLLSPIGLSEAKLALLDSQKITCHVPEDVFIKRFREYNSLHGDSLVEDEYLADRLMEGLAVIEERKEPYLLIDSNRSNIRTMYKTQYTLLRQYKYMTV